MADGALLPSRVVAVCTGRASTLERDGFKPTRTAFVKRPLDGPARLTTLGFPGDEHAYRAHGGLDMAVLVYSVDHYAFWRGLGVQLPDAGAFGENLTVTGMREDEVFIGDVYEIGSAVVQACQPRSPCYKIARRYGRKDMPVVAQKTGRTGILLRVLVEGEVAAADEIRLQGRRGSAVTVAEASRILDGKPHDLDGARRLLDLPALGSSMRSTLEARLLKASAE